MERPIRRKPNIKKKNLNAKQLTFLAGCVIGAAALIVVACFLIFSPKAKEDSDFKNVETTAPAINLGELTIVDMYRQGSSMLVKTSYLDVEFPYAFSDVITVEAVSKDGVTGLEFCTKTATMDEKIYTIWFGGNTGETIGIFDEKQTVKVEFARLPDYLNEDDRGTFKATQETFNDVLQSMYKSGKFIGE